MSIDQRLRNGLHPADPDHGLDTLAALRAVEQRATRRARTARVAVGALVAAALVAVVGVGAALQQGRPDSPDVVAIQPSAQDLIGTYVVDVPDSPARAARAWPAGGSSRSRPSGALELRPPPTYTGATTGAAWRVEDELLRTDVAGRAQLPGRQRVRRHLPVVAHRRPAGVHRRRGRVRRTACAVHRLRLGAGALTRPCD